MGILVPFIGVLPYSGGRYADVAPENATSKKTFFQKQIFSKNKFFFLDLCCDEELSELVFLFVYAFSGATSPSLFCPSRKEVDAIPTLETTVEIYDEHNELLATWSLARYTPTWVH